MVLINTYRLCSDYPRRSISLCVESRKHYYGLAVYEDGRTAFEMNGKECEALPSFELANDLLEAYSLLKDDIAAYFANQAYARWKELQERAEGLTPGRPNTIHSATNVVQ